MINLRDHIETMATTGSGHHLRDNMMNLRGHTKIVRNIVHHVSFQRVQFHLRPLLGQKGTHTPVNAE